MRRHAFIVVSALVFAASSAATIAGCLSMAGMAEVPMAGGWRMSAAWLPMCGQGWASAALSFVGMWTVMMLAMMLPSMAPLLWRQGVSSGSASVAGQVDSTAVASAISRMLPTGAGYLFVWTALGLAVFMLGAGLAQAAMHWPSLARAVPLAIGPVVLLAGAAQFSAWKARRLACIGHAAAKGGACAEHAVAAWQHGVRLGLHCCQSCAGLTATLLVMGVMDWRAMAAVTVAVTAERLAPDGLRVAKLIGGVLIGAGLVVLASMALAQ